MRKLSLFSGIGGIDLAAHWAGMQTVAFCEREPFPQRVLQKNFPGVPIYDDVCTLTKERLEQDGIIGPDRAIDLVSAGYPCQPFSNAGQRRGAEDDRHLWPEVARLLREIRPRWFVGENVAGHITLGLDDVLDDLERIGYTAQAFVIPASAVYASHRRDRVFIVAYSKSYVEGGLPIGEKTKNTRSACSSQNVADTDGESGLEAYPPISTIGSGGKSRDNAGGGDWSQSTGIDRWSAKCRMERNPDELSEGLDRRGITTLDALAEFIHSYPQPALMGQPQYDWEPPRVAAGVKNRVARLKALGNAVNPLQIYPILAAIKFIDNQL